ncbi:MAG: N-acetylmuramoyl-L-alanine amidase [Streptomycetales bacterium]
MSLSGVDREARRNLREGENPKGRRLASRGDLEVLTAKKKVKPFMLLGVTWEPAPDASEPEVWTRARMERHGWSSWERLEVEASHAPDPESPDLQGTDVREGTDPLVVGAGRGVQVAVLAPDGGLPDGLRLDLVDPGESAADAAIASPGPASSAVAAVPQPTIVTRAQWGADESLRDGFAGYGDTIKAAFIHHTAAVEHFKPSPDDSAAVMRSIYAFDTQSRGWSDIGYNFVVDPYGQIFEGRWGGIDKPVIGAHTLNHNTDTFGVAVLGNYETQQPTAKTIDAVEKVAAYKLSSYDRDPEGKIDYIDATGAAKTIDVISGHRDVRSTLCPGELLYPKLPQIRSGTSQRIASSGAAPVPPAADFDGDGYDDMVMRAPGEGLGGDAAAGLLTVIPGSASGPLSSGAQNWHQGTTGVAGSPESGDGFGTTSAAGDFDGDGFDDLAVGVPFEVLGPSAGVMSGHGGVQVLYGSASGLSATRSEWLTIADTGALEGDGDQFGAALAAGDFNGDGSDELAVGAPGGGLAGDGSVVVYPGAAGGVDSASAAQYSSGDGLPADPEPVGDAADRLGAALATGDTGSDGLDELVIGAPRADSSGVDDAGAVLVAPGSATGLDPSLADGFTQNTSGVPGSAEPGDRFGATVTLGQFDGAEGADVAAGSPREDIGDRRDTGMVHVLYSGIAGVTGTGADGWSQNSAGIIGGAEPYDRFGGPSLAAADFDAEGFDDLAVSIAGENVGTSGNTGAVAVIGGAVGGLTAAGDEYWTQGTAGVPDGNERGDDLGSWLSAGGYDVGRRIDLMIGVPGEDSDRGSVRVLFGSSSLLGASDARNIGQNTAGVPGSAEPGDRAGS